MKVPAPNLPQRFLFLTLSGAPFMALGAVVPKDVVLHPTQTLTIDIASDPSTTDPHLGSLTVDSSIAEDLFGGLTAYNNSGAVVPDLAESYKQTAPNQWVFTLRKGIKWSTRKANEKPKPITAPQIVASFQRYFDPATGAPNATSFSAYFLNAQAILEGKKKPSELGIRAAADGRSLIIETTGPVPFLPAIMAHGNMRIVPTDVIAKWGKDWVKPEHMVTSGPYTLTKRVVNSRVETAKNPHYWDAKNVVITKGVYLTSSDQVATYKQFKQGDLDWVYQLPATHLEMAQKEMPQSVKTSPLLVVQYYAFNHNDPLLKNRDVRRALSLALDRDTLVNVLKSGRPNTTLIPQGILGINPLSFNWYGLGGGKEPPLAQRRQEAQRLLEKAGVKKGTPLKLSYNTNDRHKKAALVLASEWGRLGFKVSMENEEFKSLAARQHKGEFQMVRMAWLADFNYATTFADLFVCSASTVKSSYCNKEFDGLVAASREHTDPTKAQELMTQAFQVAMNDVPFLPLYQEDLVRVVKPYVGGYEPNNPMDRRPMKDHYIIKH